MRSLQIQGIIYSSVRGVSLVNEDSFMLLYKLRFVFGGALIVACLFLLSFVLSLATTTYKAQASNISRGSSYASAGSSDNPNVVADFMSAVGNKTIRTTVAVEHALNSSLHTITTAVISVPVDGSKAVAKGAYSGAAFVADGAGSAIGSIADGASDSFAFMAHVPGKVVELANIRPADNVKVPIIDDAKSSPEEVEKALAAANATNHKSTSVANTEVQWPLHGEITTLFGVSEWPYEAVHTGLDISDGTAPGTTPIKPFKPGRVVQVVRGGGLGNHVVVDHGGGGTSVYGHLYSISVRVGQKVGKDSVIGLEGSTGVSTGTHLHFEIHLNGRPVNPLDYIPGRP